MNDLKPGMRFNNSFMELEVLKLTGPENINVAYLYSIGDGLYITVRDLTKMRDGSYTWIWGHYFSSEEDALDDYKKRVKDL